MFWKKKKDDKKTEPARPRPAEPAVNRIRDLANRLYGEGRFDDLESELSRFNPAELSGEEKESWYHGYGVAAFNRGDHKAAFERFDEGVRQCPDSGSLAFSLGQEYELRGEVDKMLACFDNAGFPGVPSEYVLAAARYAYLWDRLDKARYYVNRFLPVYFELKVLDTHFLYMRGLSPFEQVWAYLAAFSQLDNDFAAIEEVTEKAKRTCSGLDFDLMKMELDGFRTGDFSALKKAVRSLIQESIKQNFPYGYQEMRLAVFLAQEERDSLQAAKVLDSVKLTDRDFPWLDDMRLLARCEVMGRAGDEREETFLRNEFLTRQPFLFEPDNAVNFNLLRYQERLKKDFQKTRPLY